MKLLSHVTFCFNLWFFRRFVWNFFRLENEHINNCGKFRAVRDISVAPIHDSDQAEMIRMMDEDNGVHNRRKKKNKKKFDKQKVLLNENDSSEDANNPYSTITSANNPYSTITSMSSVKSFFTKLGHSNKFTEWQQCNKQYVNFFIYLYILCDKCKH